MSYLSEVFLLNGKFTGPGKPVSLVKSPSYPGSQLSSQTWLLQTTKYGHLSYYYNSLYKVGPFISYSKYNILLEHLKIKQKFI